MQIVLMSYYYGITLIAITGMSYILAIFMLGLLGWRFLSWFRSNKSGVVLFYGLSAVTLAINTGITLAFTSTLVLSMPVTIGPHTNDMYYLPIPGSLQYILYSVFVISSIVSFIFTWGATASLLHPYSRKLRTVKYWVIVGLPLVYFLS